MRLSEYTDYTLRVLMYCAAHPDERITISVLAETYSLSRNHLMKIVNDLSRLGVIQTSRGRGGGLRLIADPASMRIGDIVRASETDFRLVECFDSATNRCSLSSGCSLKTLLGTALQSYLQVLDGATLADIALNARKMESPKRGGASTAVAVIAGGQRQAGGPPRRMQ